MLPAVGEDDYAAKCYEPVKDSATLNGALHIEGATSPLGRLRWQAPRRVPGPILRQTIRQPGRPIRPGMPPLLGPQDVLARLAEDATK